MELNDPEIDEAIEEVRKFLEKYDHMVEKTQPPHRAIQEQLKALPALIYNKSREKEEAEAKLMSIKARIAKLETAEFLRIRSQKDEKKKPKYTIEDSRKKAKFALKRDSAEYTDLKRLESDWHKKHERLKDEKTFLINTLEVLKTIVLDDLGTAIRRK